MFRPPPPLIVAFGQKKRDYICSREVYQGLRQVRLVEGAETTSGIITKSPTIFSSSHHPQAVADPVACLTRETDMCSRSESYIVDHGRGKGQLEVKTVWS